MHDPLGDTGRRIETGRLLLDEDSIQAYARQWDPQSFHTDPTAAKDGFFGGLVASGWHVLSATMKLVVESRPFGDRPMVGAAVDNIRFQRPIQPGTEITARAVINEIGAARDPSSFYAYMVVETLDAATGKVLVSQDWKVLVPEV